MGLDIYFDDDIINRLVALTLANLRAMVWARQFGANRRDIAIARTAYQAALADVGVSFGLERPDVLKALGKIEIVVIGGESVEGCGGGWGEIGK